MDNVSFTSKIRLVTMPEFQQITSKIGARNAVNAPWTIKESRLTRSAYTTGILDCTVCGLTDGQHVLLNHICPTNSKNKNFTPIERFIRDKIDLRNPDLQGFILGSKEGLPLSPYSVPLFEKFVGLMKRYNIPFSQFKGGQFENHVAYTSQTDEWIISNNLVKDWLKDVFTDVKPVFNRIFDKVEVSKLDELSW